MVNIEVNIENQVHGNVPVQNAGQIYSIKMNFCMYILYLCQFEEYVYWKRII